MASFREDRKQKKQEQRSETMRLLTLITQFGLNMLVPICMCFFVGMFLDEKFGTNYISILLFFLGAMAGFRNVYVFARRNMKNSSNREEEYEKIMCAAEKADGQAKEQDAAQAPDLTKNRQKTLDGKNIKI